MHVAATWYTIDQNAPSDPFLLDLDLKDNLTREEIECALLSYATAAYLKDDKLQDEDDIKAGETPEKREDWYIVYGQYGDMAVTRDENTYLYIGLPEHLKPLVRCEVLPPATVLQREKYLKTVKYKYKIIGRNNNFPGEETYTGKCAGHTPKQAMLHALALEFVDKNVSPQQDLETLLTKDNWIGPDTLKGSTCEVHDQANQFTLYAEEHTYFIKLTESLGELK